MESTPAIQKILCEKQKDNLIFSKMQQIISFVVEDPNQWIPIIKFE